MDPTIISRSKSCLYRLYVSTSHQRVLFGLGDYMSELSQQFHMHAHSQVCMWIDMCESGWPASPMPLGTHLESCTIKDQSHCGAAQHPMCSCDVLMMKEEKLKRA